MVKILSQSGNSLADTYDVEGSIAGIDELETHELPIVHEMGATVFSERFSGAIRRVTTGAIAQSTTWDLVLDNLPSGITRILAVAVYMDAARVNEATVLLRDENGREIPIFIWDTNESRVTIRIDDNGTGVVTSNALINVARDVPSMLFGAGQVQRVADIAFRGTSTAFGAGTVTVTALIYVGHSAIGGVPGNTNSRGLPVPSW